VLGCALLGILVLIKIHKRGGGCAETRSLLLSAWPSSNGKGWIGLGRAEITGVGWDGQGMTGMGWNLLGWLELTGMG
jgi:hypothetical protein